MYLTRQIYKQLGSVQTDLHKQKPARIIYGYLGGFDYFQFYFFVKKLLFFLIIISGSAIAQQKKTISNFWHLTVVNSGSLKGIAGVTIAVNKIRNYNTFKNISQRNKILEFLTDQIGLLEF